MEETSKTKYIIFEETLDEVEQFVNNNGGTMNYRHTIYEHEIERDDIDDEQREIQLKNKWNTELTASMRTNEEAIYNLIEKAMREEILSGTKLQLEAKTKERVKNSKVRAVVWVRDDGESYNVDIEYGDRKDNDIYIEDVDKMDEALKKIKTRVWGRVNDEEKTYVFLEKISVEVYSYNFSELGNIINKLIKRFVREELTYCIKKNEVIIPQEYLDKGKEGIKEWRELKASKNKNNSMEKRMLRGMLNNKKDLALKRMRTLLWRFPKGQDERDWSIPSLTIYGNGNKAMAKKLMTQIIGNKTDQELLNMTDEDIQKEFKEYWKGVLRKAIEEMDNVNLD